MLGTAGPYPFPTIVREFQRMIGEETKAQILERRDVFRMRSSPALAAAPTYRYCSLTLSTKPAVGLIWRGAAGHGIETSEHRAPQHGRVGIYFGMKSPMMQTDDGQIEESLLPLRRSGFPSVGPQHAYLNSIGRADCSIDYR